MLGGGHTAQGGNVEEEASTTPSSLHGLLWLTVKRLSQEDEAVVFGFEHTTYREGWEGAGVMCGGWEMNTVCCHQS